MTPMIANTIRQNKGILLNVGHPTKAVTRTSKAPVNVNSIDDLNVS